MSPASLRLFLADWLKLAATPSIRGRAFKVALVVGTLLNLINQGDVLFGDASANWWKFCLTFLVPYGVSTHAAVEALRTRGQGQRQG